MSAVEDRAVPANGAPSSLFMDVGRLQRLSLDEDAMRLARVAPRIIAGTHFGIACIGWSRGVTTAVVLHGSLGCLAVLFAYLAATRTEPPQRLNQVGAALVLAGMALFLFVFPGPTAVFVYILAPIPTFRILGVRSGLLVTTGYCGIALACLAGTQAAAEQLSFVIRINTLVAFAIAVAFGYSIERSRARASTQLASALERLRALHGFIAICSWCKKVRDPEKSWQQIESILRSEGQVEFSHGICEECAESVDLGST